MAIGKLSVVVITLKRALNKPLRIIQEIRKILILKLMALVLPLLS